MKRLKDAMAGSYIDISTDIMNTFPFFPAYLSLTLVWKPCFSNYFAVCIVVLCT